MKLIHLNKGFSTMVDDDDYILLNCIKWMVFKDKRTCYAENYNFGRMHSFLMMPDKPMEVDHIDRDGLNNQRSNLRICTHQQNNWNQEKKRSGTSKYKGVYWFSGRNKWITRMRINGKTTHLGCFNNEDDAARAYDNAAQKHFGEFACLNFR